MVSQWQDAQSCTYLSTCFDTQLCVFLMFLGQVSAQVTTMLRATEQKARQQAWRQLEDERRVRLVWHWREDLLMVRMSVARK